MIRGWQGNLFKQLTLNLFCQVSTFISVTLQNVVLWFSSQEIVRSCFLGRNTSSLLWCCLKYFVELSEVLIEFEDCSHIAASVTVVGSRPDSNECVVKHLLVSFHDELMRSTYQINAILSVPFLNDFPSEKIASTTWTDHPAWNVIWVTPHQVAHCTIMGHFLLSVNHADLIEGTDRRWETTVNAENLVIDDWCEWKIVENFGAVAPNIDRSVFSQALIIESIHLCDLSALVITSDQCNSLWVSYLTMPKLV